MEKPVYQTAIQRHRSRALNPTHPHQRGSAQGTDVYFQCCEAANPFYLAVPDAVEAAMEDVAAVTGRKFKLFDYYGDAQVCGHTGEAVCTRARQAGWGLGKVKDPDPGGRGSTGQGRARHEKASFQA